MNIEKLFIDYRIDYSTKINKGWINISCPFCGDTKFHGGFSIENTHFNCWKCGSHELNQALSKVLKVPYSEVKNIISDYAGRSGIIKQLNKKVARATSLQFPDNGFTHAERQYLIGRNFSPRYLHDKYGVTGGGIIGRWKYRILIPVFLNGKLVSWTGRSILPKKLLKENEIPRYKNLSIEESVINIKECLFNIDNCKKDIAVLVEGAFDVMRLGDDFLCSMGTELTQGQIKIISDNFRKIFIMFDNEPEAQEKARKFGLQIASIGIDVEIINAYSDFNKNDGAELNDNEVRIIRKELNL